MWVELNNSGSGYLDVGVDTSFDVAAQGDLVVLVDTQECSSQTRIYGDEGYSPTFCWAYTVPHADVQQVSAQTDSGDLKCRRSDHSDAGRTLFACTWR